MRPVQIIQAASAFVAAATITFLQPLRDQIGDETIGTIGLLIVSIGFAASHVVTAILQKRRRAFISNGLILVPFGIFIYLCISELQRFSAGFQVSSQGNVITFDALEFKILATSWLLLGGLATLGIALLHRKFKDLYRDNLITAVIFLVFALVEIITVSADATALVGFLNAACILTAVHLGIAAFSPKKTA